MFAYQLTRKPMHNPWRAFWQSALTVGGVSTVAGFIVWNVFVKILDLKVIPNLTQKQGYWILWGIIICITVVALALIVRSALKAQTEQSNSGAGPDPSAVLALHKSWDGVNEVDPDCLIGPDVTNGVRALTATTRAWENNLVPKDIIIESHFEDFELLFVAISGCSKVVPGFEKRNVKCSDLISPAMHKVFGEMKKHKNNKPI